MAKSVFYSFHFDNDVFRVQNIRQIGVIEGNEPIEPNEWEEVKDAGDAAIEEWIDETMSEQDCVIVLIGEETHERPWVDYEIRKAWRDKKPILGIYIHNIKCAREVKAGRSGKCSKGKNPFDNISMTDGKKMSAYVKTYDPKASDAYNDIADNIEDWIEAAQR